MCFIALVVCYLADDFGDYAAWKPGFVRYVSLLIGDYWGEIVRAVTRIPISTTDGVFRFPNARPQGYFEVGQDVVFINYAYGGVIFESLPEVAKGTVTAISTDADGDIVALAVPFIAAAVYSCAPGSIAASRKTRYSGACTVTTPKAPQLKVLAM